MAATPSTQVIDSFFRNAGPRAEQHYAAFYSSVLGGIVTDPALMVINMDDRMVHRGTGVFDTAILVRITSARHGHTHYAGGRAPLPAGPAPPALCPQRRDGAPDPARVPAADPSHHPRNHRRKPEAKRYKQLENTACLWTLDTIKVHVTGFVRYWLSSGRGDMGLNPLGCDRPTLYVMVYTHRSTLPVLKV